MVRPKPGDDLLMDFGGRDVIPAEEEEEEEGQQTPTPLRRVSMGGEHTRENLSKRLFAVFGRKQPHTPPRSSSDKEGLRHKSLELRMLQLDLLKQHPPSGGADVLRTSAPPTPSSPASPSPRIKHRTTLSDDAFQSLSLNHLHKLPNNTLTSSMISHDESTYGGESSITSNDREFRRSQQGPNPYAFF